ncbi:MAG: cell division protein FtsI, partial [Actinomycetales bacterium]|nr:cell division protein FtsI [Actinomycetales bacterium]
MAPTSAAPRRRAPLIVLIAAIAVAALVVGGLLWRDRFGDGQEEAEALAADLARAEAPEHQEVLGPLIEATGAAPQVEVADPGTAEDGARTVTLAWTWTLPDEAGTWEYTTEAALERGEDGWAAQLAPEAYAPDLAEGEHLDLRTLDPALGSITDRDGAMLYGEHDVKVLGLDKTQIEEAEQEDAARELAGLLGTDADRYAQSVADHGPEAFVPALTIRVDDEHEYPLADAAQITGFLASEQTRPLAVERDYAPGVLGSLREASGEDVENSDGEIEAGDLVASGGVVAAEHDALVGTEGVEVLAVHGESDEKRSLHTVDPVDGTAVTTTLDGDLQQLATAAIADEDSPSAVIAL